VDIRAKLTLDALRVIARHVSGYPGRKNLLWLSAAFPLSIMPDASVTMVARFSGMRNTGEELTAVASALTDAQIAVYPVDPRGWRPSSFSTRRRAGSGVPSRRERRWAARAIFGFRINSPCRIWQSKLVGKSA